MGSWKSRGLGADELRRRHPHLIVCGHKGFLSGPYQHRPALPDADKRQLPPLLQVQCGEAGATSEAGATYCKGHNDRNNGF